MFLEDKASGEFPHCVMCKAPIYSAPLFVDLPGLPTMKGDYHQRCFDSIGGAMRAYQALARWSWG